MEKSNTSNTMTSNAVGMSMFSFIATFFFVVVNLVGYALIDVFQIITLPVNFTPGYGANLFRAVVGTCFVAMPVFFWVLINRATPDSIPSSDKAKHQRSIVSDKFKCD